MKGFSDYDYLCDEPYFYEGIGHVKCPTLRDIRKITYNQFNIFLSYISITQKQFLETFGLTEKFNSISDEEKEKNTVYNLLTFGMNRADVLTDIIERLLRDSDDLGIGKPSLDDISYTVPQSSYYGRQLKYSIPDFKIKEV